jgi:hypothetical protein
MTMLFCRTTAALPVAFAAAAFLLLAGDVARAHSQPPDTTRTSSPSTPAAQVRLALELARADATAAPAPANTPNAAFKVVASPTVSTFARSTGAIQVAGDDLSYAISVSPEVERDNRLALLWTLQISGRSLPAGVTSMNLNGGTRVAPGKRENIAEMVARDPKTGRTSTFRLYVTATIGDGGSTNSDSSANASLTPPAR